MEILRNDKWRGLWDLPKYQEMRDYISNTFAELVFYESNHTYFIHGNKLDSVSAVTGRYKPKFDSAGKAKQMYEKYYDDPSSKYYHMTTEQILEQWNTTKTTACNNGTDCHEFAESCFYFMLGQYDKILPGFEDRLDGDTFRSETPKEDAVVKFWNDLPQCFIPIAAENKVCREDLGYAGTFDILFYYDSTLIGKDNSESGFVIFDYKTNATLFKNYNGEKMLYPFDSLLNCSINAYRLQLSLYQLALDPIGCIVRGRRLIWLKDDSTYEKFDLQDYSKLLEWHLQQNKATS